MFLYGDIHKYVLTCTKNVYHLYIKMCIDVNMSTIVIQPKHASSALQSS